MKLTVLTKLKNEVDHIDNHLPMGTLSNQFWVLGCWRVKDEGLDDDERENKQTALSKLPFTRFLVCTTSLISLFAELLFFLKLFPPILLLSFFASLKYSVLLVRSSLLKRAFLNNFLQGDVDFISGLLQNCKNYQDNENLCIINSRSQQCCKNVWNRLRLQKCLKCSK